MNVLTGEFKMPVLMLAAAIIVAGTGAEPADAAARAREILAALVDQEIERSRA